MGDRLPGRVSKVVGFGAYVEADPVIGLVHVTEIPGVSAVSLMIPTVLADAGRPRCASSGGVPVSLGGKAGQTRLSSGPDVADAAPPESEAARAPEGPRRRGKPSPAREG